MVGLVRFVVCPPFRSLFLVRDTITRRIRFSRMLLREYNPMTATQEDFIHVLAYLSRYFELLFLFRSFAELSALVPRLSNAGKCTVSSSAVIHPASNPSFVCLSGPFPLI